MGKVSRSKTVRLAVTCRHGVRRAVEDEDGGPVHLRHVLREMLMACPQCWFEATSVIEDPGQ